MEYEEKQLKEFIEFSTKLIENLKSKKYKYLELEGDSSLDKAYFENQVLRVPYYLMRYYLRREDLFSYNDYLYLTAQGYNDLESCILDYLSSKYCLEDNYPEDEEIELDDYEYNEDYPYTTMMNLINFSFVLEDEFYTVYDNNGIDLEEESLETIDESIFIKELSGLLQYSREYFDLQRVLYSYSVVDKGAAEIVEKAIYEALEATNFKEIILNNALEQKKVL